jgi:hypothetical protein
MKVVGLLSLQITATCPPEEVVIPAVARVPLGSPPVGWYRPQKAWGASVSVCFIVTAGDQNPTVAQQSRGATSSSVAHIKERPAIAHHLFTGSSPPLLVSLYWPS